MTDTRTFKVLTQLMPTLPATTDTVQSGASLREKVFHDLRAVEEFLDWLEANGHADRELIVDGTAFVVRWR
jgi:hypothetical protein